MEIKAVKLYEDGYMIEPFALGGEDQAAFDESKVYSVQFAELFN